MFVDLVIEYDKPISAFARLLIRSQLESFDIVIVFVELIAHHLLKDPYHCASHYTYYYPPVIHVDTSLIPTKTPTISPITSTIPPTAPTTHYTSPFIHTDSSDDDTPDTPPSPTHEIPSVQVAPPTVDYSSSVHFTSDDSSRDSPSDSSSETSLDSSLDAISNSSSGYSPSDHSSPALPSGMRSSHQLCLSVPSILYSSAAIIERPSHSSSASPSHKRNRTSNSVMDLKVNSDESYELYVPRETSLRVDVDVEGSDEPYSEPDIDPKVQAEINECIAYVDALRAEGIDARVVVETVAQEEVETSTRDTIEVRDDRVMHLVMSDDILEPAQKEGAIERDQRPMTVATSQQSDVLLERTSELERDNTRLKGTLDVATEALEAHDTTRNHKPLAEGGDEQGDKNGDDYEGGNGGGNGNGNENREVNGNGNGGGNDNRNSNRNGGGNGYENHNVNFKGFMPIARECTYQDFLKCQPLNFNGTEGVIWMTCCALTWWNSHKRTIRIDAAYELAMLWTRIVSDEEDKVERFFGGLSDNIQGNVISVEPTRHQDAIRITNNLMDQKLKGYAKSAENKRRKDCPKLKNQNRGNKTGNKTRNNEATTKAYAIREGGANPDSNVITGMFLFNNCYASMLFDSGGDRSFVSSTFSALLDVAPSTLDTSYDVELADGRISKTNVVLRGCTLGLLGHLFDIDLMPVELGSFDVIIGMDWLANGSKLKLHIISCTKTHKYMKKGCQVYLVQVTSKKTDDKSKEKRLEDVPIVREFPKVFPEDLPGLPPARQFEFQINLVPSTAPVTRAPYQLAPAEMQELSTYAMILALPEGSENFVVYCDASHKGLGAILMQKEKVIPYTSRQLMVHKKNYTTHDLEFGAVLFTLKMWRHYLDGNWSGHDLDNHRSPDQYSYFLPIRKDDSLKKLMRQYLKEVAEDGNSQLTSPKIIHETTEKIVQIKSRIQAIRDHQKSYADIRWKPLEFQVGDKLSRVHITFHVSNLKKCLPDETLVIPFDEIQIHYKLQFVEEPVEIIDREVKRLKQSRILIVKVCSAENRSINKAYVSSGTVEYCWELLKRLRFVPTDRVIQFLLKALCVPAGSSSCDSAGHIEAVPASYDIVPAGKGIRVYKFNLAYVAMIKWVVELPFNACLLSSTRSETFISTSVKEIDIVQLGIVSQVGLKLLLRFTSVYEAMRSFYTAS
uniref:Putative reverse transcriptase domain-containing protein n=1 Tax=Tanacetum cinerariifolium TaxID=118510 RepID=A0A6L2J4A5_TANCI|nr:putative reverse transcriptase domain-containing protein [Tanacetum cinerariifolium]